MGLIARACRRWPANLPPFAVATMPGALIGTTLGTSRMAVPGILKALGVVLVVAGVTLIGVYRPTIADGQIAQLRGHWAYRIAYLDPALVRQALGGRGPLPFVADPVLDLTGAQRAWLAAALDVGRPLDEVGRADAVAALADLLAAASGTPARPGTLPLRTMRQLDRARRLIARGAPLAGAAAGAGFADQSHLSRQFRRAYGLTPGQWAAALTRPSLA